MQTPCCIGLTDCGCGHRVYATSPCERLPRHDRHMKRLQETLAVPSQRERERENAKFEVPLHWEECWGQQRKEQDARLHVDALWSSGMGCGGFAGLTIGPKAATTGATRCKIARIFIHSFIHAVVLRCMPSSKLETCVAAVLL